MIQPVDIVSLCILLGFVVVSAVRGWLLTVLWLVGLVLSYTASVVAPIFLTVPVANHFHMSRFLAGLGISIITFVVVSFVFGIVRKKAAARQRSESNAENILKEGPAHHEKHRFFAALLGGFCGIIVAGLIGWCYDLASAGPFGKLVPDASTSMTAQVSKNIMYGAIYMMVRPAVDSADSARLAAALLSSPTRTVGGITRIGQDPDVQQLMKDPSFLAVLFTGDVEKISQHVGLKRVVGKESTAQVLQSMGVPPEQGAMGIPIALSIVGEKLGKIVNDTDTQESMKGLEADGLLDPDRVVDLMSDPRFLALMRKAMEQASSMPAP